MKEILIWYGTISGVLFALGIYSWVGYTHYLALRLLHHVDKIVDPGTYEANQRRGDPLLFRWHRLITYTGAAAFRWINRRTLPWFDMRELPAKTRIQLALHYYWLLAGLFFMLTSFAAFRLVEYIWGVRFS